MLYCHECATTVAPFMKPLKGVDLLHYGIHLHLLRNHVCSIHRTTSLARETVVALLGPPMSLSFEAFTSAISFYYRLKSYKGISHHNNIVSRMLSIFFFLFSSFFLSGSNKLTHIVSFKVLVAIYRPCNEGCVFLAHDVADHFNTIFLFFSFPKLPW